MSRKSHGARRHSRLAFAVVALVAALTGVAQATHWPQHGGDAGHSGAQTVSGPALPLDVAWNYSYQAAGTLKTGMVIGGGAGTDDQVLSFAKVRTISGISTTYSADLYVRLLSDKSPIGAGRHALSGDQDALGDDPNVPVSSVSSSSSVARDYTFLVYNDDTSDAQGESDLPNPNGGDNLNYSDNDIAIAQVDEGTGALVQDVAVGPPTGDPILGADPATDGYEIESSPLITPPLSSGGLRYILFTMKQSSPAANTPPVTQICRVTLDPDNGLPGGLNSDNPLCVTRANINTKGSLALAYLVDPNTQDTLRAYVIVPFKPGAGSASVRAFELSDLDAGPASGEFTGTPMTPITTGGSEGAESFVSSLNKTDQIYTAFDNGDGTTTVRKFAQSGNQNGLTQIGSAIVSGKPAFSMAVSKDGTSDDNLVVTTDVNLHLVDAGTMAKGASFSGAPLAAGFGFARNAAATANDLIFVVRDNGRQLVLRDDTLQFPPTGAFPENQFNFDATYGIGQPGLSRGFFVAASEDGVFAYETGTNTAPSAALSTSPNPATTDDTVTLDASGSDDDDGTITTYDFDFGNGTFVSNGADPTATHKFAAPGTYTVRVRVTDNKGGQSIASDSVTVTQGSGGGGGDNVAPTASFTASPNPGIVGQAVTFNASGSRDTDGSITTYEWDLNSDGTFETNTGATPTTSRTFTAPASYIIRLRVTDNAGASATAAVTVTIVPNPYVVPQDTRKRPRSLSLLVTPRRDRSLPLRFLSRGKLNLPAGVTRAEACKGRVKVRVKRGQRTISTRTVRLSSVCTYRSRVTFKNRRRLGKARTLRFQATFEGNDALSARRSRTRVVAIR